MRKILLIAAAISLVVACKDKVTQNTADSDTDFHSEDYIMELAYRDPAEALRLTEEAEEYNLLKPYQTNVLKGIVYHNTPQYYLSQFYYLKAYNDSSFRKESPDTFIRSLGIMAHNDYKLGEYTKSLNFIAEGLEKARANHMESDVAYFLLNLGLNKVALGGTKDAYYNLYESMDLYEQLAKQSGDNADMDYYLYAIGETVNAMTKQGDIKEAIFLLPRMQSALEKMERAEDTPPSLLDLRRASVYSQCMETYQYADQPRLADKYYRLCSKTETVKSPYGLSMLSSYLLWRKEYKTLFANLDRIDQSYKNRGDTCSEMYLTDVLVPRMAAFQGMGNYSKALDISSEIIKVKDQIYSNNLKTDALQVSTILGTQEMERKYEAQKNTMKVMRVIVVMSLLLLIGGGLYAGNIHRYSDLIRKKNAAAINTINDLLRYKEIAETAVSLENGPATLKIKESDNPDDSEEIQQFRDLDNLIRQEKLFAKSGISRDVIIEKSGVPAYKFAGLFTKYTGMSYSNYMNNLRMEYAAQMLRDNKEYTIESIASDCGCGSRSTFYMLFMEKYGISPNEYRQRT
ncbi:MAG: helix-turn-helix transcriptional regulator [Bacteroidales bacterium]|nr:helix-turn-helix transcriptional regulator [Bacteroidales bacterium]